jgi:hypothetical protein
MDLEDGQPTCDAILGRVLGATAPSLAQLSELDREGIRRGEILVGMTRGAVFMAVGYPPYYYAPPFLGDRKNALNHDPSAQKLTYVGSTWDFIPVSFAADVVAAVGD